MFLNKGLKTKYSESSTSKHSLNLMYFKFPDECRVNLLFTDITILLLFSQTVICVVSVYVAQSVGYDKKINFESPLININPAVDSVRGNYTSAILTTS